MYYTFTFHLIFLSCISLIAMKMDRNRLKSDACDIHLQMKQLYCTLGDKEAELRDFIRSYDQRKQDCQETIKQVATINC